jgi:hypothetical protein
MVDLVDRASLTPLIAITQTDPDPDVQVAALEAATRLPLSDTAWRDLAVVIFEFIDKEASGTSTRKRLLICAARIPLSTFRERLRTLASTGSQSDQAIIHQALHDNDTPLHDVGIRQNSGLNKPPLSRPLRGNQPHINIKKPARSIPRILLKTLKKANQHAAALRGRDNENNWFGDEVIHSIRKQIVGKTIGTEWPVAKVLKKHLNEPKAALSDDQMVWVLSRGKPNHIIRQMTGLLTQDRTTQERQELLKLLGKVGDNLNSKAAAGQEETEKVTQHKMGHAGAIINDRPKMSARSAPSPSIDSPELTSGNEPDFSTEMAEVEDMFEASEAEIPSPEMLANPQSEQRRVHAQLRQANQRRHTFLAGADNTIRCWIGLPDEVSAAVAPAAIPEIAIPSQGLPLSAELCWRDQSDAQPLLLPPGRTARSGDCDLSIFIPEGERYVSAEIVFRYRGRAFEVVQVEAFVISQQETEQPHHSVQVKVITSRRQLIELPDSHPFDATLIWGGETASNTASTKAASSLRIFGGQGGRRFELPGSVIALNWLNQSLFNTQKSLIRQRTDEADSAQNELDADSPELLALFRDMARHGATLFNELGAQQFTDPGERIQLLNREPQGYVPLEFIYDKGYPADDAVLCAGWQAALLSDEQHCPVCSQQTLTPEQRDWTPTICPLGFWSMQKIIERVDPGDADIKETSDGQSHPSLIRRSLPPIDSILFAASHRVPEAERLATEQALRQQFRQPQLVNNWEEWKSALHPTTPPLLLVLPHHDVASALDFLEIGDAQLPVKQRRLSRAQITDHYVNPEGKDPGPILLLLGCRTGTSTEDGYVRLTRRFQQTKTSIVLGTMAQILGRHAAPVARELVAQLVETADPQADFGTLMRRVRRRMLAKGYLMAFCLIALGDAEWRLTPRAKTQPIPSESDHVPH